MSDPTPYTAAELAEIRRVAPSVPGLDGGDLLRRLLATLDDIVLDADRQRESYMAADARARQAEAERDAARADRVCWRETHNQVAAERDALRSVVRRYHAGWYIVSASAPLRDVWCKDHYPDDGHVTEELTPAEADAARRALASPTEGNPDAD